MVLPSEHQRRIDKKILIYIVAEALPLETVSSFYFQDMLKEVDWRVHVVCTKTLRKNIALEFLSFKVDMKRQFAKPVCVCLTADIWERTADKLKRRSAAIACRRFTGMFWISCIFYC